MTDTHRSWLVPALGALALLVLAAPVFAWAAGAVGYTEPLTLAAEATGAGDDAQTTLPGLLPDYTVPGLPAPVGTLLSGLVGTALVLVLGTALGRTLTDSDRS